MNSWLLLRRLRGPAFLILVGITALLNQWDVLSFSHSWPLYLILAGIFGLAERAVMAAAPPLAPPIYQGPYAPPPYTPAGYTSVPAYTGPTPGPAPQPVPPHDSPTDPDRRS
jgi:hypothetical protein